MNAEAARNHLLDSFAALDADARTEILQEQPDTYWRTLDLYVQRLTDQVAACAANLRRDRRRRRLARLGQTLLLRR